MRVSSGQYTARTIEVLPLLDAGVMSGNTQFSPQSRLFSQQPGKFSTHKGEKSRGYPPHLQRQQLARPVTNACLLLHLTWKGMFRMMSFDRLAPSPCEEEAAAFVFGVSLLVERFNSSACPSSTVPWRVFDELHANAGGSIGIQRVIISACL